MNVRSMLKWWPAVAVVAIVVAIVAYSFPPADDYRYGADEGAYFRQGKTIVDRGVVDGFRQIGHDYVADPNLHDFPNPFRVATIAACALALHIDESYIALSWLSLIAFALLLIAFWQFASARWTWQQAFIALCFVAMSPLALGMARRALMDSLAYCVSALSLFAFIRFIEKPTRGSCAIFVFAMCIALLVKETALFLLAFYALAIFYWRSRGRIDAGWLRCAIAVCAPVAMAVIIEGAAYGFDQLPQIARVVRASFNTQIPYAQDFSQGPWYRYIVDFILLSPWIFLLAVAYLGLAMRAGADRTLHILIALCIFLIGIYALPTKSVRYLLLVDLAIRCLAAAMICALAEFTRGFVPSRVARFSQVLAAAIVALLVANNLLVYERFFGDGAIYDTVTYNFLREDRIVPQIAPRSVVITDVAAPARERAQASPTAENFVLLAAAYCAGKMPLECKWASREAIRLAPGNALAFNNLCAANNDLHDWSDAIDACGKALQLKPDFELARNNLRWAQAQSQLKH